MKRNILTSIFLLLFSFSFVTSQESYTSKQIKDILSNREYSYKSIEGLDVTIHQDDVIMFYENGKFSYKVADKDAEGTWLLSEKTLEFTYPDTVRYFKIISFSKNKFSIHEESSNYKFHFEYSFANKLNIFSSFLDGIFKPIVDNIAKVIFYDVSRLFGQNKNMPFIVIWLIFGALFFTWKMNFINIRGFNHAISLVKGDYHDPENKGEVSHFQALTTALSGTVGLGNIAGVAIAISLGGPGATFWMIVAGLIGMSSKFVECTLGVKYRKIDENGVVSGGPMYYLEEGLRQRNLAWLGRPMGIFYATSIVVGCLGIGNMFQSNQAFQQFIFITGGDESFFIDKGWIFGFLLAAIVGIVIIGGIKGIARVTSKLVPFMTLTYVIGAILVIILNSNKVVWAITSIFTEAFNPTAMSGGILGVMILGFQRATFSNEAGIGSAAIAHATVKTKEPVSEGYVGLMEPFIDTVIICTLTALVILTTVYDPEMANTGIQGITLTSSAFSSTLSWSVVPLSFIAILFAFSTTLSWSYYGLKGWTYIVGESRYAENIFKIFFCIFVALGCMINLESVLKFSDALVFLIAERIIFL